MIVQNVFQNAQRIALWIGCVYIGTYIIYRHWRQRKLKWIDEGFEDVTKLDDTKDKRVVILGLDRAGKTSIVQQLSVANGELNSYSVPPLPTQGSDIYRLWNGTNAYYIWDIGGTNPTKKYWGTFLHDIDLLVFVMDSSHDMKISEAVSTLNDVLSDSRIGAVPILVLASKQDSSYALSTEKIKEILDLQSIPLHKHKVEILPCQTRPLPEELYGGSYCAWHHKSIDAVRKKIFAMAT